MADYVSLDAPYRVVKSSNAGEGLTNPVACTRAEHDRIAGISSHYRTATAPAASEDITEMDQAAKDVVDAAAQKAVDDAKMAEIRDYVYALKKQVRRELNTIRNDAGLGNLTPQAFNAGIRSRLEEL